METMQSQCVQEDVVIDATASMCFRLDILTYSDNFKSEKLWKDHQQPFI